MNSANKPGNRASGNLKEFFRVGAFGFLYTLFTARVSPFKIVLSILAAVVFLAASKSYGARIEAKTDTSSIRIGEQFSLQFSASMPKGGQVSFPFLTDTFNHFEIVTRGEIDTTLSTDGSEQLFSQKFILTSFDSGFYVIPPFPFRITEAGKIDTLFTEALLISVASIPVDTTKEIKAIKNIMTVPFPWKDYLLFFMIAVIIIVVAIILWKRYRKDKLNTPGVYVPDRPAHEIALEGLKRVDEEKLWQQGFVKKYHSEISDILRQYIERRFEIGAMEQTTDEILQQFSRTGTPEDTSDKLRSILRLADMVKFAKVIPLPPENEKSMTQAVGFIHETRPVINEDIKPETVK